MSLKVHILTLRPRSLEISVGSYVMVVFLRFTLGVRYSIRYHEIGARLVLTCTNLEGYRPEDHVYADPEKATGTVCC